jgi:drug/metabolite transporter (DMT)-like permease
MSIPAAFAGVVLIWSTTPLAIKWSSQGSGFLFGVSSRMTFGALLCVLLMLVLRRQLPRHKRALQTYIIAGLGLYTAMLSVYWGAQYIPSGLVSVIFGLSPLVTGLLAGQWLNNERFGIQQFLGSIAGILGLAVIFNNSLDHAAIAIQGIVAVLISVCLHSLSAVLVKRSGYDIPALALTTGGLVCATPLYLLTWVIVDGAVLPPVISVKAGLSIVYLSIFGSVIGFVLYFYLLKRVQAGRVALVTLITPVIALFIGQTINDEPITGQIIIGAALILSGLGIYQWRELHALIRPPVMVTEDSAARNE